MKISIGNDHRGVGAKEKITHLLRQLGHSVVDDGSCSADAVDYPDIAAVVARKVAAGEVDRGILVCGTGIGMSIAANKIHGIRAAVCDTVELARLSRQHNNANVLSLPAKFIESDQLPGVLKVWLDEPFEGGRHQRRVEKIHELEL
jgi:ribose 5-phosphate isomerase B